MRKHRKHLLALATVLATMIACGRADERSDAPAGNAGTGKSMVSPVALPMGEAVAARDMAVAAVATAAAPPSTDATPSSPARDGVIGGIPIPTSTDLSGAMLVRQGEASIEVKHLDDGVAKIRQAIGQFGGFVANTSLTSGRDEQRGATLELRIPAAQFDPLLASLGNLGKVERVTATAQDVGEEFVDVGARVANARRVEARLVEMVASRTGKLSEVLTVEQELRRVREEIERYEARLRFLEKRSALSTLTLSLHEPLGIIDNPRPGPLAEALGLAWQRFIGMVAWCIASLGVIVPIAVLAGVTLAMLRRLRPPLSS